MKSIIVGKTYTDGIGEEFKNAGWNVIKAECAFEEKENTDIIIYISKYSKDNLWGVFTLDFFPNVAKACNQLQVKYISWVWDCPHAVLWSSEARLKSNYIFLFDFEQYQEHLSRGMDNVYYLPIAPDIDYFRCVIEDDDKKSISEYSSEVAFVGNFYDEDRFDIFKQIKYLPEYTKGYLDSVMNIQKNIWGIFLLKNCISDIVWDSLKKYVKWDLGEQYEEGVYEVIMLNFMAQKIAKQERIEICSEINRRYNLGLYTKSKLLFNKELKCKGYANYKNQMPLIFNYSKININITLRSITSGIPLRVMDVLACGGFLITNYQSEIDEYFDDGDDLVVFSDFEDLYNKIDYYLKNDKERERIALNGYEKVKKLFSLKKQMGKLLDNIDE